MTHTFVDFLISLADADTLSRYARDPEATMLAAGLSTIQKDAIRNGDAAKIRRFAAAEMGDTIHGALIKQQGRSDAGPTDVSDVTSDDTVHNIVENTDLSEDVVVNGESFFYDHLFEEPVPPAEPQNELVVVGTGIKSANHITAESRAAIMSADKVLYCVADLAVERLIRKLNANTEDLYVFYADDRPRRDTYDQMVDRILESVRSNKSTCVVFYGHPGIFVLPSYRAIRTARKAGHRAWMLPAISSLDCMFADVGFDPSRYGCQIFEATDLLIRQRKVDPTAAVVIFQIACVGDLGYKSTGYEQHNVPILAAHLAQIYGNDHDAILYEAAQYPICDPMIKRIRIADLANAQLTGITTLYLPPKERAMTDMDMIDQLGLGVQLTAI
jgi:precorrin-6B methylase 1